MIHYDENIFLEIMAPGFLCTPQDDARGLPLQHIRSPPKKSPFQGRQIWMNLATMFWNPRFLVLRSKSLFSRRLPVEACLLRFLSGFRFTVTGGSYFSYAQWHTATDISTSDGQKNRHCSSRDSHHSVAQQNRIRTQIIVGLKNTSLTSFSPTCNNSDCFFYNSYHACRWTSHVFQQKLVC